MSNLGKRFVETRRKLYSFTLHPDTAREISMMAITDKICKSELVEKAVKEYVLYHGHIYRNWKAGLYDNKKNLTPEEEEIFSGFAMRAMEEDEKAAAKISKI